MMKQKYLIILSIMFLFFSCGLHKKNKGIPAVKDMKILSIDPEKSTAIQYSQFIDSIRYIPLSTPEPAALLGGGIHKIIYAKNRYFIFDEKKVLVFDSQGKYIFKVGRIGRGPREIIKANDFFVDTLSGTIELLSFDGKIVRYELNTGRYINAIKINGIATDQFCKLDREEYVIYGRDVASMEDKAGMVKNLFFFNSSNNTVKSTLEIPFYLADYHTRSINSFSKEKGGILFLRQLDNNIYLIDKSEQVKVRYIVDYGNHNIPLDEKFWKKKPNIEKTDYVLQFSGLLASDSYLHFLFYLHDQNYIVLYDRIHDILLYGKQFRGIKNNVDFGPVMFPGGIYKNFLISTIEPGTFRKHFDKLKKKMGEEEWEKYIVQHSDIKKILKRLKPEDNPILAIYYLKEKFEYEQ